MRNAVVAIPTEVLLALEIITASPHVPAAPTVKTLPTIASVKVLFVPVTTPVAKFIATVPEPAN
jgi:hypothetical protein